MNGDQRMMWNNAFSNVPKKITVHKEYFFLLIPAHSFFCKEVKNKLFLVIFEKEQPFLFIPTNLFLYVLFLFVPLVSRIITSWTLIFKRKYQCIKM